MIKQVVILNGSPRPQGNTSTLINWLQQSLPNDKYNVSQRNLYSLNFKGCNHCDVCKKTQDKPACVLQDDFTAILNEIIAADIIIVASPVYCWSFSGCMGAALDRFQCLFKRKSPCLFAGKKIVGLFTAGGDYFDGMELCVAGLQKLTQYGQAEYAGTITAIFCDTNPMSNQKTRLVEDITKLVAEL